MKDKINQIDPELNKKSLTPQKPDNTDETWGHLRRLHRGAWGFSSLTLVRLNIKNTNKVTNTVSIDRNKDNKTKQKEEKPASHSQASP